jgi:hypothetical protein
MPCEVVHKRVDFFKIAAVAKMQKKMKTTKMPIFLAYLVPLDVDVTKNITAKLCEVWSEFNIFCTLVTMATATILNFFNPPKAGNEISQKKSESVGQTLLQLP